MLIGVDGSRAFIEKRTGIEEYSYQVIKHLMNKFKDHRVILYLRKNQVINFKLPDNWKTKVIKWPFLWTQIGLSLEMLFNSVDVLFIPAHTVPFIHARNTIVTVHGLEYEFCPEAYSWWERVYMRCVIKNSCRWAKTIIAVSENTKKDLVKLYKVPEGNIEVVYEGYEKNLSNHPLPAGEDVRRTGEGASQNTPSPLVPLPKGEGDYGKYILFIGRLEERKNIVGIIKTYEILKEQYKLPHKLILAGKFGYEEEKIQEAIDNSNSRSDIILPGYVSDEEKWELLENADVFLFPTFYEGFGLPILEAQSAGVPVVAGNNSSIPEITCLAAGPPSAMLVDSHSAEDIADVAYKLVSDKDLRDDIIKKGYENVKRFSWEKCAEKIAEALIKG